NPAVAAVAALRTAVAQLNLPLQQALVAQSISADKHQLVFDGAGISYNNIYVDLLWLPAENDTKYTLAWQVNIQLAKNNENWMIHIDAQNGSLLKKENLSKNDLENVHIDASKQYDTKVVKADGVESVEAVSSSSYKVIPYPAEDPNHAAPTVVSNPWEAFGTGNLATSLKWNSDGSKDYDSTKGNNVYAQPDLDGKQATYSGAARSSTALPNLTFNFTPNFDVDPLKSSSNINFAVTNLFYWNNLMHDASYQYGFTEAAGNFQTNNINRGGKAADAVIADAMDASGTNNANFSTPVDGSKPRMQMYLWSPSSSKVRVLKINSPSSYAGFKTSTEGAVSTKNKLKTVGPVTANVVLFKDKGNLTSYSACVASGNAAALKGKIAYIDRGDCAFTDKIMKAQTAGAVGVILGDNVIADAPIAMGGTNNKITIPAVSIRKIDADSLKSFLIAGTVVNATLQADTTAPQLDGDVDNGIIAHEYTHGISGRLTGGPSKTCLQNKEQMGEGWSDYMALMMTTDWATASVTDGALARPIGNYAFGLPTTGGGIRNYPYSTDKSINPWTYDSLSNSSVMASAEVHNIGEPWCEMLWDMTWKLIGSNGINRNFFNGSGAGGNSIALKLMIQGLKLQPCVVGYVTGRDAILKADTLLYGGQYSADIW
ncbi:MAG: M36 family metallopeptidase, partial [Williamsia sp.]|nr:M36 family metallopeptidase [Williamsia sp.]